MRALALFALMHLLGCARPDPCELEPAEVLVHEDALAFDGVAVARAEARAIYAWSSARGLFVRERGGRARRIGDRCAGGIALASRGERTYVACAKSGDESARAALHELNRALSVERSFDLGRTGRDGRGVALALAGERVYAAFHDGSVGAHAIYLATLAGGGLTAARVSQAGSVARDPALLAHGGHVYLAYAELDLGTLESRALHARVLVSRDGSAPVLVARARVEDPAPTLAAGEKALLLGYRDSPRAGARSELMLVRLDDDLRALAAPRALGRANAEGSPTLYGCDQAFTALLPREYGSERFVAVQRVDRELVSRGAGHQFYTSGRDFVLASGACEGASLWLVAADRATPTKPGVDAMAMRFRCSAEQSARD